MTTLPSLGAGEAVLAIDIGGFDIKASLVRQDGSFSSVSRRRTPLSAERPGGVVLDEVARIYQDASRSGGDIPRVGVAIPGLVDEGNGVGLHSDNLGWRDFPIRSDLEARLGVPVSLAHDVRAAGEAEYRFGHASSTSCSVVMVIGTGIGAALFIDGRLRSEGGFSGEVGHLIVVPDGLPCRCGLAGCLETVSSAGAIARLHPVAGAGGARAVAELARAGDARAQQVWRDAVDGLGIALAHIVSVVAPESIVIGGGLSNAGNALLDPVTAALERRLSFHRRPRLELATLGGDAGLVGAALRARAASPG